MQDTDNQVEKDQNNAPEAADNTQAEQVTPEAVAELSFEDQLAEANAKIAEMQDAFLRAKAESDNVRRRAQEDIARAHKFAVEGFAESLLSVKDSLEMALAIETPSVDALKEGVSMTLKQLSSAFERNKLLEVTPAAGEKLDPMKHQAVSTVPAEQEANTVVTVLQKGYTIADRLLRPALVTVAAGK